jgi:hypothetical protein
LLLKAVHLAPTAPAHPGIKTIKREDPALPHTHTMDALEPALAAIGTSSQDHLNVRPECGPGRELRVHAPLLGRKGHAIDRQHVCRNSVVDAVLYRILQHVVEAVHHNSV